MIPITHIRHIRRMHLRALIMENAPLTRLINLLRLPAPLLKMHSIRTQYIAQLFFHLLIKLKLAALARGNTQQIHGVDFLERAAAGFNKPHVDHEGREEIAAREDVAVGEVDVVCDEGGEERQ